MMSTVAQRNATRREYPYVIENGHGERLRFLRAVPLPGADRNVRVEIEGNAAPGAGAPMHVHFRQEEAARVVSGRLGYQVLGEEPKFAGPGETVVWAAGTPHKWWNAGTSELRFTGWCQPANTVEFYLGALFDSVKRHGRGRPALLDAAYLMTRYRTEYAVLEIPAFVRRVVMPALYVVGLVIGAHRKYRNAPEPVSRSTGRTGPPPAGAWG